MAEKVDSTTSTDLQVPSEDTGFVFHYNLPDELALHSVEIVDGLPQLGYKRSLNVPTFQENDLAAVCRSVSENKCPEFFYLPFLPNHPMHLCRYYKTYSPLWLQETGVGELLADIDKIMKYWHIGKPLSEGSQLKDLASRLDFPQDGHGKSIIMSCDYVKVQEGHEVMIFPEPPKIKIIDEWSSSCSEYLTKNFQWFAHAGEHKLLKYQELIKHIVAMEWLDDIGIRANREWMMSHTSKLADANSAQSTRRKKPPYEMMPELGVVKRPTQYDQVQTVEAIEYECCKKEYGATRKYGYIDFKSGQMMEDGIPSPSLKLKADSYYLNMPPKSTDFTNVEVEGVENEKLLKWLPAISQPSAHVCDQEITQFFQDCISLINKYLPQMTKTISVIPSNHFAGENPNMPVVPGLIPDVKSWDELEKFKSVAVPWIWEHRLRENAIAMASGGVTTHGFHIENEEPYQPREAHPETQRWRNISSRDSKLVLKAEHASSSPSQLTFHPPSFQISPSLQIITTEMTTHRIGSWNLQSCTLTKKLIDEDVMATVCSTILNNGFDILAFQETGKGALQKICEELNHPTLPMIESLENNSKNWKYASEEKAGRMYGGMEYSGFLWNQSAGVKSLGVQKITSPKGKIMVRMPIAGKFLVGSWEVVLVNFHLKADGTQQDRERLKKELKLLPTLVSTCSPNGEDVVLIGDFNKNPEKEDFLPLKEAGYTNIFGGSEWTNISSKNPDGSKSYDNIWVHSEVKKTRFNHYKEVIRENLTLPSKKTVSDHCPIWADFDTSSIN